MAKKLKVIVLLAVMAVSLAFGGAFASQSKAKAEATWDDVVIESSYISGDSVTIPSRKLVVNGKEYAAEATLVRPDGTATSAKNVTLDAIGKYTVRYFVTVDGVPYSDSVSFLVNEKNYAYSNEETKVVYGTGVYAESPETTGLYVNLKEQDVLGFNGIIEIPNVNEDISIVKYFIAPSELESADFTRITFTLTDAQDPSCYLRIVAQSSRPDTDDGRGGCYLLAGGNGQQLKGDQGFKLHVNNNFGARSDRGSFFGYKVLGGKPGGGLYLEVVDPSALAIDLKFNPVTCEVKADNTVIIDTDSKEHYGGATDVKWTGFTSGNVKLSVKCEGYNKSSAGFVLTSVKDVDLASEVAPDTVAPEVTITSDYDLSAMPVARAGAGEYYMIPAATAYDLVSGECDVKISVYRDYGSESQSRVNVKDGKFETAYDGNYAIVYVAYDASGNKSEEKIVYVTARENVPDIQITAPGFSSAYEAGGKVVIPKPEVTGGSGNKEITARVYSGNIEYEFDKDDEEWAFFPETAGTWTVEYSAIDYTAHTAAKSYDLIVIAATAPSFRETAALPKLFIAGLGNRLPELIAYDYTSGSLVTAKATVSVTDKNGTKTYKSGDVFVPEIEQNGDTVEVTYVYDNGKTSVSQGPFEIPAIFAYENDNLAVDNYFYDTGENAFGKTVTDRGIRIVAPLGEHSWTFANALVSNGFSLTFGGVENACAYEKAIVSVTDVANESERLDVEFVLSDTGRMRFACGGASDDASTNKSSGDNGETVASVTVGLSKNRLLVNGYVYDPDKYADGREFKGFSSGMVNLSFRMVGAEENSVYYVSEVNGYTITRARQDRSSPNVSITGDYGGYCAKGETYVLCPAVSADVLAPVVDFSVSVKDPNGNYAVSADGVTLKDVDPTVAYTLVLDKYGVYTVSYLSVENNAPKQNPNDSVTYEINVCDDEAPVYKVTRKMPDKVKLGEKAELPTFTVTDNLTAAENIISYAIVVNPNGRSIYAKAGSFKFDFAGKYKITYYFVDEAGNAAVYSFTVTVE